MAKVYKKFGAKKALSFILSFALLFAVVGIFVSIRSDETSTISSYKFDKGALDDKGEFIESDVSLYTEEMFACQGLTITKDFESFASYEVFYYRIDKTYIGRSGVQNTDYSKSNSFLNAAYARVVLTPSLEEGESISFFNKYSLARDIKIEVLKDQTFVAPTLKLVSNVREKFTDRTCGASYHHLIIKDSPFVYQDLSLFSNKTITKISVPVSGVVDCNYDSTFTVFVVSGNMSSGFKKIQEYNFVIPAGTYSNSLGKGFNYENNEIPNSDLDNVVWFEFECEIKVGNNQTLAFGSVDDTVYSVYRKNFDEGVENHFDFHGGAFGKPTDINTFSIYYDVECYE